MWKFHDISDAPKYLGGGKEEDFFLIETEPETLSIRVQHALRNLSTLKKKIIPKKSFQNTYVLK